MATVIGGNMMAGLSLGWKIGLGAIAGGLSGFAATGSLKGALAGAATGAVFAGVGHMTTKVYGLEADVASCPLDAVFNQMGITGYIGCRDSALFTARAIFCLPVLVPMSRMFMCVAAVANGVRLGISNCMNRTRNVSIRLFAVLSVGWIISAVVSVVDMSRVEPVSYLVTTLLIGVVDFYQITVIALAYHAIFVGDSAMAEPAR